MKLNKTMFTRLMTALEDDFKVTHHKLSKTARKNKYLRLRVSELEADNAILQRPERPISDIERENQELLSKIKQAQRDKDATEKRNLTLIQEKSELNDEIARMKLDSRQELYSIQELYHKDVTPQHDDIVEAIFEETEGGYAPEGAF